MQVRLLLATLSSLLLSNPLLLAINDANLAAAVASASMLVPEQAPANSVGLRNPPRTEWMLQGYPRGLPTSPKTTPKQ